MYSNCDSNSTDLKPTTVCVEVCTDNALLHGVGLMQSELIFLALCCGGDYNQVSSVFYWSDSDAATHAPVQMGLSGCGSEIASRLTRYSLGESLVNALQHESAVGFCKFLRKWRSDLCSILACDPAGFLGRKYPRLAEAVPDDFLNINILVQYVEPLTSWSSTNGREYPPVGAVQSRQADFVCLAAICEAHFAWSGATIQAKFRSNLWEGACMRALCQVGRCLIFFRTVVKLHDVAA
jgi:hypothetical protein